MKRTQDKTLVRTGMYAEKEYKTIYLRCQKNSSKMEILSERNLLKMVEPKLEMRKKGDAFSLE